MLKIDVIVPGLDLERYISDCISSIAYSIKCSNADARIIYIDDGSSDGTISTVSKLASTLDVNIQILMSDKKCSGPGICRNIGINACREGSFIMFVDGDDLLAPNAISLIIKHIQNVKDLDILGYSFIQSPFLKVNRTDILLGQLTRSRKDLEYLTWTKRELLKCYLEMGMDGSSIFHIYSFSFITDNKIRFREGLHEDIDFLFKCLLYSTKIDILDHVLYFKRDRPESIIHTWSVQHVEGYLAAWEEIANTVFMNKVLIHDMGGLNNVMMSLRKGIRGAVGVLMTMARATKTPDNQSSTVIIEVLNNLPLIKGIMALEKKEEIQTKYDKIYSEVINFFK